VASRTVVYSLCCLLVGHGRHVGASPSLAPAYRVRHGHIAKHAWLRNMIVIIMLQLQNRASYIIIAIRDGDKDRSKLQSIPHPPDSPSYPGHNVLSSYSSYSGAETRHRCSQIVFILYPSLLNIIKVVVNPTRAPRSADRRPKNDSRPDNFLINFGCRNDNRLRPPKPVLNVFLASVPRSPLYMGTAAGFDIALVIAKALSSKVTDQQVERLGHGSSLDEDVT
jgi:hypothetical protein